MPCLEGIFNFPFWEKKGSIVLPLNFLASADEKKKTTFFSFVFRADVLEDAVSKLRKVMKR